LDQLVCDGKTLRGSAVETEDGTHRFIDQVTVYARALGVALAQKTLHRQIRSQFEGKRQIPHAAEDHEKRHGRDTTWNLRAREAPDQIKANWPGCSWIVKVIWGCPNHHCNAQRQACRAGPPLPHEPAHSSKSIATTCASALEWSIENEWHWVRDVQLGEDAHRYANRMSAPLFSFLRTVVMNLLRRAGFRSIHAGQQDLAQDISRMLALGTASARRPD
jgi:hypothetical protein